ncbi:uncharacterized protein LOC143264001 [Megachile rotundata]|uniref:uncharacterized protein LOC143264001 n=1 Tax=Megachile rotundata TaxID=143995 RepID=UPI003FCFE850
MGLRNIARRVGVSHMTVHRIICDEGLRPYRVRKVQALQRQDYSIRRKFCRWMLKKLDRDPQFLENVCFTDESNFSNASYQNSQNTRIWARRNPHAMIQIFNQGRFSINVWRGIIGNHIIGPIFFHNSLTGTCYLNFLRTRFITQLRQVIPHHRRRQIYFMHDDAPPHFIRPVREFLSEMFGSRRIGRRPAPHLWPPRSPDLTPMDFFFWRAVKNLVYRSGQQITSMGQLKLRIKGAFRRLAQTANIYENVRNNLKERLRTCLRNNGGHIEAGNQARLLRCINVDGSILRQRRNRSRRRGQP